MLMAWLDPAASAWQVGPVAAALHLPRPAPRAKVPP